MADVQKENDYSEYLDTKDIYNLLSIIIDMSKHIFFEVIHFSS